ncbi:hypothetical protein ALDI51_12440 [Alicycliphilus denitrificans]|nr:hypothetical protein ALDI51_12440 [Alicycliphilus denitrificans]
MRFPFCDGACPFGNGKGRPLRGRYGFVPAGPGMTPHGAGKPAPNDIGKK